MKRKRRKRRKKCRRKEEEEGDYPNFFGLNASHNAARSWMSESLRETDCYFPQCSKTIYFFI